MWLIFQESFVPEDAPNEDLNYGPTPEGAYGPGQVTVYKTVNHIQHVGVLNIGPQFNFGASNFPSWQQQAPPPEFDFAAHIDKCKSSVKMIENKDIEAIAPKIEERDLYQLGHDLDIPSVDELLNSWTSEPSDYSTAHRLLLYWTQVKDGVSKTLPLF